MTAEHYQQAEGVGDRTDVIGALPFDQLAEAQVHATLALAASPQDIAAELSMLREVVADLRTLTRFVRQGGVHSHGCTEDPNAA